MNRGARVMQPQTSVVRSIEPRIIPRELFTEVDASLLAVLSALRPEDWHRPTVCSEWNVKDIASHLLDGSLRRLSLQRDNYRPARAPTDKLDSHASLVRYLNKLNADWTDATDRLSPRVLIEFLGVVLPQSADLLASLNPHETAIFPVGWAGESTSLNWMDVAREFTERWHHQEQIVEAVGVPSRILSRRLYYPVLETFLRALPYTLCRVGRPEGTTLRVTVTGEAGGDWYVVRVRDEWALTDRWSTPPTATAIISERSAWLMFTKKWDRQTKLARFLDFRVEGDEDLGLGLLDMVSVMA